MLAIKAPPTPKPATPAEKTSRKSPSLRESAANPAWMRLALGIQPKLNVSAPDDLFEREADAAAERVMEMPNPPAVHAGPPLFPAISAKAQRQCATCAAEEENLRRKENAPAAGESTPTAEFESGLAQGGGSPLPASTCTFMEHRFGADFGTVRLHTGEAAEKLNRAIDAQAFTHGQDIYLGRGHGGIESSAGRRLLAHELAHVVQNTGGATAPMAGGERVSRQTFGTAKSTAPPAQNESPGDVFRGRLKNEVATFANAGVILDWIVSQRTLAGGATVTSFFTASLLADAATLKKMKPQPTSADELQPALEMLEYYGVLKAKDPGEWDIQLAPLQPGQTQADVNRAGFDQNRKDIAAFQKSFEQRFDAKGHPIKQIAQQELLEDSMAAGAASEKKNEKDAAANLAAVTSELDEFVAFRKKGVPIFRVTTDSPAKATSGTKTHVLLPVAGAKKPVPVDEANFDRIEPIRTGTSKEVETRRKSIESRLKGAERGLYNAQAFHRFAIEMVWFLHQLDATSTLRFTAGTYPQHGKFGEYAADMYPVISEDGRGFYSVGKAEQFVDDINTVAEAGHPIWGKFAWQIVYNDAMLQATINAKYGPRMSSAPHHGPAPDKLHMHLDIRPLNVVSDPDTGFALDSAGRVVLY